MLVILMLATIAYASPNADIELTPVSLYETNEAEFDITIDNLFKDEVIEQINVNLPSMEVTDVTDFFGWENNYSDSQIVWFNGDIETNSISLFRFTAQAGLVGGDTTEDIVIITTGSGDTTDVIEVTILDDTTPPELSNPIPEDGGFLRQGITDQTISVEAADPETGILNGTFAYWDCSPNATNTTTYSVSLTCSDSLCETTADLSYYEEGELMCFEYTIYNNALETATLSGTVGFDGTPPAVELTAPDNSAFVDGVVPFIFTATDNLAPVLDCSLLFEDNVEDSTTANNGEETTLNFDVSNLTEGAHEWKIICIDGVDLEGSSETRDVITGSPPEISLDINYIERTIPTDFTAIITDETGVDNAYAVFDNSSITLTRVGDEYTGTLTTDLDDSLGDNILTIIAEDVFGFTAEQDFTFTLIPGYIINLNIEPSPAQPEDTVEITGTVTLDDGSDIPEENITLYLLNQTIQITIVNQSFEYSFNVSEEGTYEIIAEVVSSEGFEHQASAELEVAYPVQQSSSSSSRRHSSGSDHYCGDGRCTRASSVNEDCGNCPEDCGECPVEEPEDTSSGGFIEEPEEPRTPAGVGSATGMFRKVVSSPLAWLLFLAILGTLYIIAFKPSMPKVKRRRKSNVNWKGYFDRFK